VPDTSTFTILGGLVAVTQNVRAGGCVTYRISGGHARGTVTFVPHVRDDQPVPDRMVVRFGAGEHLLATRLDDLPVVAGVTLIGGADGVDLDEPGWTQALILSPRDPGSCPAPALAAAVRSARTVCRKLASWYRRLDRDALMLAAAKRSAGPRLARCLHQRILPGLVVRDEDLQELAAAQRLAGTLQQLSPLRLLPGTPIQAGRPEIGGIDPDIYISSDDDGDWLTCPACEGPTVMIRPGAKMGGLLAEHAEHRCPARH
jgi:hypothetical protein